MSLTQSDIQWTVMTKEKYLKKKYPPCIKHDYVYLYLVCYDLSISYDNRVNMILSAVNIYVWIIICRRCVSEGKQFSICRSKSHREDKTLTHKVFTYLFASLELSLIYRHEDLWRTARKHILLLDLLDLCLIFSVS